MRLRNTAFASLAGAISTCALLESLDLSRNHLHGGSLLEVLDSTTHCPRLHSFNWSGNSLGSAGTFLLANHIANNAAWKSTMQAVSLRSCDMFHNMPHLAKALTLCTRLQTLDISGNGLLAHEIAPLFRETDKDSRLNLRLTHQHQLKKHKAFHGSCDCVRCRQKVTEQGSCYCTDCGKRDDASKPTT